MKLKTVDIILLIVHVFTLNSYSQQFIKDCKNCIELKKEKFLELKIATSDFKVSKAFLENGQIFDKSVKDSLVKNREIFNYKQLFYKDTVANTFYVVHKKMTNDEIELQKKEAKLKKAEEGKVRDSLDGSKLDDLVLKSIDGNSYDLNSLKGKVVVLNFWFTKCKPCVAEIEALNEMKTRFKDAPVVFFAVTWNRKDEIVAFLEKKKFDFIQVTDATALINKLKIPYYPYNVIITPKGVVEYISDTFSINILKKLERRIEKKIDEI